MNIKMFERKLNDVMNQQIAIEHCKRIVKDMSEKENMYKKNNEILLEYSQEIDVEKDILCAIIPELLKLIKNKSITFEYVIKNGAKKAIIIIS